MKALVIFVIFCFASSAQAAWVDDYLAGIKVAKEQGKPALVAVLAGDECPWSAKFQSEVLFHPDFLTAMQSEVVLIRRKVTRADENIMGVQEYPMLILLDPSENVIIQRGYLPLEPAEWAKQLKKTYLDFDLLKKGLSVAPTLSLRAMKELYVKAKRVGCKQFQREFLELGMRMDKGVFFPLEKYYELVKSGKEKSKEARALRKSILNRDPKNQKRSRFALALLHFQSKADRKQRFYSPKEVIAPLTEYVKNFGKQDPQGNWQAEMVMAQYLRNRNLLAQAEKHARRAYRAAPEAVKPEIQNLLTGFIPGTTQQVSAKK
jgi:hypothetical protein